ncbi:MAG: COX15/CtaA family protein [Verrucomicrobiota bacterium]|nr:COX15/CtaA family protein [Limisphaera sp.]MDW8381673.1 COX15/CtaA family protein [Verrucomicrobiota bacterium]
MRGEVSSGLHRFAVLTACAVLGLIGAGGLVTSHGAGLAVPDWPNTYGYNLFFFPISHWIGGIFYEHTHRLWGAVVGFLTLVLAVWMQGAPARPWLRSGGAILLGIALIVAALAPSRWQDAVVLSVVGAAALVGGRFWPRCRPQPARLRWLSLSALGLVILQGVLGGLRVVKLKDELGIVHATLAQLFFVLMAALALLTSRAWGRFEALEGWRALRPLRSWYLATALLILGQLILGATMRHEHAGLAIPDFPLAYGRLWPATDPESIAAYNRQRLEARAYNDITAAHIRVHMAHRLMAVVVLGAVLLTWQRACVVLPRGHAARFGTGVLVTLTLLQIGLGAWTVWSNKAADIATVHVITGAALLMGFSLLALAAHGPRMQEPRVVSEQMPAPAPAGS